MKNLIVFLFIILVQGCYIPNDPPKSELSFSFKGRLEKLEDAFYSSSLKYKERDFKTYLQSEPEYEFEITRSDTVVKYIISLSDCQSIYYLVKFNDNWNCDSSYIHINQFSSNIDSLPISVVKSIFKKEVIDPLINKFNTIPNKYYRKIEKSHDTVFVKILNEQDTLRKMYVYSFDTIGNSIAEKEIINYLGDSTIIYQKSQEQRFVYLEDKKVIYK